jgi:uncharacterized OsmC-like protein
MSDLNFNITSTNENPTKLNVNARQFKFVVDEPAALGGTDHGANPVEYLLGALAGCLNVVSHVVANELNLPLKGVTIDIEGNLNPDKFFGKSTEERAGFKGIRVTISPVTDADQSLIQKWLEIVESRCPVSDNLVNPTPVSFVLG